MNREGLVTLLISLILWTEVEIVTTDDNGSFHRSALNNTTQNMATNADIASERALLVNIVAPDSFTWGLEAKTNVVIIADGLPALAAEVHQLVDGDIFLLLEGSFSLLIE